MIMFTAGSACLVYSRFGQILYDYAVALMLLGFGITLCSQLLTFQLIKLLGRRSIIIFMMVALMVRKRGLRDSRASLLQQFIKGQYRAGLGQGRLGRCSIIVFIQLQLQYLARHLFMMVALMVRKDCCWQQSCEPMDVQCSVREGRRDVARQAQHQCLRIGGPHDVRA
jgi:hypothetical protein